MLFFYMLWQIQQIVCSFDMFVFIFSHIAIGIVIIGTARKKNPVQAAIPLRQWRRGMAAWIRQFSYKYFAALWLFKTCREFSISKLIQREHTTLRPHEGLLN